MVRTSMLSLKTKKSERKRAKENTSHKSSITQTGERIVKHQTEKFVDAKSSDALLWRRSKLLNRWVRSKGTPQSTPYDLWIINGFNPETRVLNILSSFSKMCIPSRADWIGAQENIRWVTGCCRVAFIIVCCSACAWKRIKRVDYVYLNLSEKSWRISCISVIRLADDFPSPFLAVVLWFEKYPILLAIWRTCRVCVCCAVASAGIN